MRRALTNSLFIKSISSLGLFLFFSLSITAREPGDPPSGAIKGSITTADNKPAADVTIQVKSIKRAVLTEPDGQFIIRGLAAGAYELEISLVGHQTQVERVTVNENQVTHIQLQLQLTKKQLEEVVVISGRRKFTRPASDYVSKMPLRNLENSQVYSTITRELITEQMVFSVDDATKNAPGLQKMWEATGRGGDGGAYYNSRGFILQSQLRNGVAGNITSRIDAANIESVEIIKGPSATLFGSTLTSYGGFINRVTKKPYDKTGGELSYSAGSYGFNRVSADFNSPLNHDKTVLFRLNAAYQYEGSWQDNGFDKGLFIAPSLFYQANDRLWFHFDVEHYSGSNSSKPFIFFYYPSSVLGVDRADKAGIDYKRSYSANDIFQVARSTNLFGQMNYRLSPNWTSQTNFSSSHSFSDGPYAYFYLKPNSEVTGDPNATGADYLQRADQSTANSEITVTEIQQNFIGEFQIGGLKNRFVGGLDFLHQNSNQHFYGTDFDIILKNGYIPNYGHFNRDKLDSALINGTPWTWPYEYKNSTYSAYISNLLNITDNLLVSAAVRVDHFDNKGSFDEASGKFSGACQQTTFSPKFGVVWQPVTDKISVFANYQNGFVNQDGVDYEGNAFKPEEANQLEGGVKVNAFGGKLSSTISYYHIKVKDVVRTYFADPLYSIQDGAIVSKGFEAEVIANPVKGLNLVAGFAYNDSKMEKADADVEGRRPATAMSPYAVNFWLSYRQLQGKLRGLGAGLGGNYASDNDILSSAYYGKFILPAYTVLGATLFYEQPKFRVGIKVDNLTNRQYWIGYTTMNPQKLRSVTGSIAFKF
jgi:iron complex outermembrane receptor protein